MFSISARRVDPKKLEEEGKGQYYCCNIISVFHPDKKMIRKAAMAFNKDALLEFFHPVPNGIDYCYDWRGENWGTRWDILVLQSDEVDVNEAVKRNYFNSKCFTGGGPPLGAFEKARWLGFTIDLSYKRDAMFVRIPDTMH